MQLEAANVVGGGRVRGTLEECRKSLAARDVAALCMGPQLACGHVLDHTPTQRADGGIGTHGELLLSEAIQGPRSFLRTGLPAPTMVSSRLATNPRSGTPRSGYRGSDLVPWHELTVRGAAAIPSGIEGSTDARRTTMGCPAHGRSCAQSSRDRRGGLCGQRKISLGEWGNFALTVADPHLLRHGRRDAYTASFKSFAARKAIFLLALILMASPVAGLRPIRAGRLRTCRMPRPPSRPHR